MEFGNGNERYKRELQLQVRELEDELIEEVKNTFDGNTIVDIEIGKYSVIITDILGGRIQYYSDTIDEINRINKEIDSIIII